MWVIYVLILVIFKIFDNMGYVEEVILKNNCLYVYFCSVVVVIVIIWYGFYIMFSLKFGGDD